MIEKSCGAVVFTRTHDGIKYVIIRSIPIIQIFLTDLLLLTEVTEREFAVQLCVMLTGR